MTLSKASHIISKALITGLISCMGMATSSCDSWFFDGQGDCAVHYRVPVTFKENHYGVNVISNELVSRVSLYFFDRDGQFVLSATETAAALQQTGYNMEVDLKPGRYSVLAWAEGYECYQPAVSYIIGGGGAPASVTDLTATLPLKGSDGSLYIDQDIVPLYYGYVTDIEFPDSYGVVTLPEVDLIKDTHIINVSLENIEGTEIAPDAFTVSIESDNSQMGWDNLPVGARAFSYRPWCVTQLSSERGRADGDDALTPVTGLFAEMTVGRLMTDRNPVLVVHRKHDNKDIIRLDLVKFLCMVKGHYPHLVTDQEYLDWTDRHTLSFFIDADLNWYTAGGVYINGWRIVPPQQEVVG